MRIPKTFTLGGITIQVKQPDVFEIEEKKGKKESVYGYYNSNEKTMYVAKRLKMNNKLKRINSEQRLVTFYHELVHAINDILGNNKLYYDEKFTNGFSTLLYECIKTRKYN